MKQKFMVFSLCACMAAPLVADDRWDDMSSLVENVQAGKYGTVTSVLVMDSGKVVYEGYFNDANAGSLHNTRSVTKTMTGMAVGAAVDDGLMNVDTPAAKFFTDIAPFENQDPRKLAMTVEDMITMSGILDCNDSDIFSHGNESRMHAIEDWTGFFWDLPIRGYPSWVGTPKTAKYGRIFSYCSAGVEIVGQAVERAANTTFQAFVEERFFKPLEISRFEWSENGLGQAHKSGGLLLTTLGLAKFAEMQRNDGIYKGKRVLSKAWTQAAIKPRVVAYADRDLEYGYLWWLANYEVDGQRYGNYSMSGNGGNRVIVMPEHKLVVVVTKTDFNQEGVHQATDALLNEEVVRRLAD